MPTPLEENLRAVQHSIAQIKRDIEDSVNVKHREILENQLDEYYEEEKQLLEEIMRID